MTMSDAPITSPRPFCFVLMPFSDEFNDVYQIGIKEACEAAGAYCERVDEQIFEERILDRIYNQIAKADFVIADMSGRNPNVFYEVGYAHALGKRTVLLTRSADDIPFDLQHFPHIVYGSSLITLRDELKTRVEYFVRNPARKLGGDTIDIELFLGKDNLSSGTVRHCFPADQVPNAAITVHNASAETYEPGAFKIAVITSSRFSHCTTALQRATPMPNGDYLHMLPDFETLFPRQYTSFVFGFGGMSEPTKPGEQFDVTLRVFTKVGTRDFLLTMLKIEAHG